MHEELLGKRLLVLGGNPWADEIKRFTDENGIVLVVAGNRPQSKLFHLADECYVIDSTDGKAMKQFIKEKSIDGVYMGGSEPVIAAASVYLKELGMPCYCTPEQWKLLQNKAFFKELCTKHGLPVVPRYSYNEIEQSQIDMFPVITKPVDGCGSSGFSVCNNMEELKKAVLFARENSPSNTEIIERYVSNEAICVFYTFSNGVGTFSGSEDKYPVKYPNGSFVGGLYVFRSFEESFFRNTFEDKILSMFREIGVKEGCLWIEVFRDHGKYYFNEIGYRVGGTVSVFPVAYMCGINQVATDIYYSLTNKSILLRTPRLIRASIKNNNHYCVYTVHVNAGTIASFEGENGLINCHPNIVRIIHTKEVNDVIHFTGTFAQVAAVIHFVFDDLDELDRTIHDIHKFIIIRDSIGNNMVQKRISAGRISTQ